ncbi:CxC2 domain-containing protein [Mycena kentingensis (nom. inval.)]|nr:CxC2 domain-containing protein [Mycena kentingensis (nom. inval.)]
MPKTGRSRPFGAPPPGSASISFTLDEVDLPQEMEPLNSFVDKVSDDGRRATRVFHKLDPPSPVKATRRAMQNPPPPPPLLDVPMAAVADDNTEESYTMLLDAEDDDEDVAEASTEPLADNPQNVTDQAMQEWSSEHRDGFLRVLLWHDGRKGMGDRGCRRCTQSSPAQYRCADCGDELVCKTCCCAMHEEHPLHWIEMWNGQFFARVSLKSLGVRVQMGHRPRERCSAPTPAYSDFTVLHLNGIHSVNVDFCGCHLRQDAFYIQLLRRGWYPATTTSPRTVATFQTLDTFHTLSLKGKITAYDYYGTLEHLTNGSGVKPPDRYKSLLRERSQANFAVRCPACPRPEVNLPPDWQSAPPEMQCLYIMFIAIDACFRLKRRMISSWLKDPGLGTGWAYFVEWMWYRDYLASTGVQKEISTCTGLAALDHANTKFSRGYAVTGVAMCICARHEFVLPNGVGDLQKGERYANIDYIFASVLRHISRLLRLMLSYDIACQWWKHLKERLLNLPPLIRLSLVFAMIRFVIPKMHIKAHTLACQLLFSLYFALGSGQTDGEGIERLWAMCGAVAASTKLSGPGARADQLDDHWGFWNWMKTVGLAALLRRRLDAALLEREKQEAAFAHFSAQQADRVPAWLAMVNAFEAPRTDDGPEPLNPYEATVNGLNEDQVRKTLEADEARELATGAPRIHDVSPVTFVTLGLDIEEMQRKIRVQNELQRAESTTRKINLADMRRDLNKSIQRLRTLQATYTPGALVQLAAINVPQDVMAEDVPLVLPSDLAPTHRRTCANILAIEQPLREAQCRVAIAQLRNQLHIKARLLRYKKNHSRHQAQNTRSRGVINRNESKVKQRADKYQACRRALCNLRGTEPDAFPELRKRDIRCMDDVPTPTSEAVDRVKEARRSKREAELGRESDDDDVRGESRRVASWIWHGTGAADSDMEEALRVEWCKAYARVRRWREEVLILQEEWRRLPISLQYEADRWKHRASSVSDPDDATAEGKVAYGRKQERVYLDLIHRAEITRTEKKLKRGFSRRTRAASMASDENNGGDETEGSEAEDGRGDVDSEEEEEEDDDALQ